METLAETYSENESKFTTYIALGSFGIGSLLFIAYLLKPSATILFTGFYYVICALIVNGAAFLSLVVDLFTHWENRENIIIKILIMLANIPITLLYLYIIFNSNHF